MSKELDKSVNSLKKMGESISSVGQKMTTGITLPLVGMGAAMMKTFMDFESVMTEIEARTGATAEEMKKMQEFAIEMGAKTAFSATEAAEALLELTSSGSSAAEAMAQLPAVLALAAAGALELGRAADGVTDILAQFQLKAKDAAMVADQLAKAAGASSATVEDLLQAFGNAGPVMAQFGLSVEESAAALAVLAENGVKGAEAGTMLKSMLLNMSRDTEDVAAAWKTLGVSMYDAQGNMRDIDEIFKDINKAMAGMSMEEQNRLAQALAGSYGIVGFNALRASNGISEMQGAMAKAAGASEVADARMNTLAGRLDSLMGSLETLEIVLGGLAEGPLTDLVKWLTDVVNAVTAWVQANPQLAQIVMIILAIVAAIGPLLLIIGQLIAAWTAMGTAITFVTTMMALPLAPIALLVAALVVLALAIFNNWFGIRDIVWGAVTAIVNGIYWLIDQVGRLATAWIDMAKIAWTTLNQLNQLPMLFTAAIAKGWSLMLSQAGTSLSQLGTIIWERLKTLGSQMMILGQAIIDGLINGMKSKAVDLVAYIFGLSKELTAAIKQALGIRSPSKVFMGIGQNVVKGFQEGMNSMGGLEADPTIGGRSASGITSRPAFAAAGAGNVTQNFYIQAAPGTPNDQVRDIMRKIGKETKKKSGGMLGNGR